MRGRSMFTILRDVAEPRAARVPGAMPGALASGPRPSRRCAGALGVRPEAGPRHAEATPYLLFGGASDVGFLAEKPVHGDPDEGVLGDPLASARCLAPVDAASERRQRIHLIASKARLLALEREVLRDPGRDPWRRRRRGRIEAPPTRGGPHGGLPPTPR